MLQPCTTSFLATFPLPGPFIVALHYWSWWAFAYLNFTDDAPPTLHLKPYSGMWWTIVPDQGHPIEPHILPHWRCGYGTRGIVNYHTEVLLTEPGGHKFTQLLVVVAKHARPHIQLIDNNEDLNEDPFVMNFDPESDHLNHWLVYTYGRSIIYQLINSKLSRKKNTNGQNGPIIQFCLLWNHTYNTFTSPNHWGICRQMVMSIKIVIVEMRDSWLWLVSILSISDIFIIQKILIFSLLHRTEVYINQALQVLSSSSQPHFLRPISMHSNHPNIGCGP